MRTLFNVRLSLVAGVDRVLRPIEQGFQSQANSEQRQSEEP